MNRNTSFPPYAIEYSINWRRRDAMEGKKIWLQNPRRTDLFYVVSFDAALWSWISWISYHACSQLAEKGVRLLCSSSEGHSICDDLVPSTFSLSVKRNEWRHIWIKSQPIGEKTISSMIKNIVEGTSLEECEKKFTNHSARLKQQSASWKKKRWKPRHRQTHKTEKR